MLKKTFLISSLIVFCANNSFAKDQQYPNITGKALFEYRFDRITSANDSADVDTDSGKINVDTIFGLNFNKNWSIITDWKFRQVENFDQNNPERYRNILSTKRGFGLDDEGIVVEQLKGQFQNDDLRVFFGKFNPAFGSAFKKEKRIGVFTTDFTKDYELREKIGAGFTALLEHSEITVDAFYNDETSLSNSAINKRGRQNKVDGLAGGNSTPSSYVVSMEGEDLFGVNNLFYNVGYRNLAVDNIPNRDNETGLVGGLEYLVRLSSKTSIIPFVEVASIRNLSGESSRNATYTTVALVGKYSGWSASIANVIRDIRQKNLTGNQKDHLMQYSIGYRFDNNIAVDLTRADLKENRSSASLIGMIVSYAYNF